MGAHVNKVKRKILNFDCKISPLTWKIIYTSVSHSNDFRTHRHPKRERERARRESRESELEEQTSHRTTAPTLDTPVRSRRRDCPTKIVQHEACRRLTGLVAHDPPMTNLSLSRSPSPFPSICDHSLFLLPLLV